MSLAWIVLKNTKSIGPIKIKKIYNEFPKLKTKDFLDHEVIVKLEKIINSSEAIDMLTDSEYLSEQTRIANNHIKKHIAENITVVTIGDETYPKLLRFIDDPPPVLYAKGNTSLLKKSKNIAVVGTRNATDLGFRSSMRISSVFGQMGYTIVSGLALGIDTAAHKGALRINGKTIAVLAGPLNKIYPKENTSLANDILDKDGLLLSEIPLEGRTFKQSFVMRDRIQSGISLGVCPVQTDVIGGTQHTIKYSKEQGRLLFCPIPTEKGIKQSNGIEKLINDNEARVIKEPSDYEKISEELYNIGHSLIGDFDFNFVPSLSSNPKNLNRVREMVEDVCLYSQMNNLSESELLDMVREVFNSKSTIL
jgi:DNA processing protein